MSYLDILGTYYQVEQRGQLPDLESLPLAHPKRNLATTKLYYHLGDALIRIGEKLKGQVEQPINWPSSRVSTL